MTDRLVHSDSTRLVLNVAAEDQRRAERTVFLRNAGYTVVEAASESQAIRSVIHRDIALTLLDGDLPECDLTALGETLQRMRPGMAVVVARRAGRARSGRPRVQISIRDGENSYLVDAVATALCGKQSRADISHPDVVTDASGQILDTSEDGARLLNATPRGLFSRNMITFFDTQRDVWQDAVRRARAGERVQLMGRLRPRERRPLDVSVRITSTTGAEGVLLEWAIDRSQPQDVDHSQISARRQEAADRSTS